MLSDPAKAHLERAIYPLALAQAGEPDTRRNRMIAASDYWLFLESGGGSDEQAVTALARGMRACDAR